MEQCIKHPKYNGKKKPKSRCEYCLSIYFKRKPMRIPVPPPTLAFQDKSKYSRKKKHKSKEENY